MARNPHIVATAFLSFGPGQVKIASPVFSCRFRYIFTCSVAKMVEFLKFLCWWEDFPASELAEKGKKTDGTHAYIQTQRSIETTI